MQWDEAGFSGDAYPTYSWGSFVVEVEIDPLTFDTKVERVTSSHDLGRAVNPVFIEGQIEGGVLQGLGYASMEVMVINGTRS